MRLYIMHDSSFFGARIFEAEDDEAAVRWAEANGREVVQGGHGVDAGWEVFAVEVISGDSLRCVCYRSEHSAGVSAGPFTGNKREDPVERFTVDVATRAMFRRLSE